MRQRNIKNQDQIIDNSEKNIKEPKIFKGKWKNTKYKKICLEIGMGKGSFISELANKNEDNLYIGIELNKGVVSLAIKKIKRFEEALEKELTNLKIISFDAINLEEIFDSRRTRYNIFKF